MYEHEHRLRQMLWAEVESEEVSLIKYFKGRKGQHEDSLDVVLKS